MKEVRLFFQKVLEKEGTHDINVQSYDCKPIRTEFFKLHYAQNEFVVHEKADAFEALDKILNILHASMTPCDEKDLFSVTRVNCASSC
jgi:hypothetical protein